MKTKIFVPSEANIDLITHSANVEAILDEIKFSEFESYVESKEISAVSYYSRINLDKQSKPVISNPDINQIRDRVKKAVEKGYESILFITSDSSYESFGEAIDNIKKDFEVGISIYNGKTYGYPLAYMAVEADKAYSEGVEISKVLEILDAIRDNNKQYVFKPKKYKKTIFERSFLELSRIDGDLYESTQDGFVLVVKDSKLLPFQNMISLYCKDLVNKSIIPFVMYANKNQELVYTAIDAIKQVYDKIKTVKTYPLPICFSSLLGANSDTIVLGYTQKVFKEMLSNDKKEVKVNDLPKEEIISENKKVETIDPVEEALANASTNENELTEEELALLNSIPEKPEKESNEKASDEEASNNELTEEELALLDSIPEKQEKKEANKEGEE